MFLAEEVVENAGQFAYFDLIMILFSVIVAIGFVRLVLARDKNIFAIGFTSVCLVIFLFTDYLIVRAWLGIL
ncbi:hypothetical protein [Chengkuizengella axinellae]|uniref:DUF2759 family protein n=1 Tax=Chengkuizengella axinellae TaxID=3064388 RepID=A0ABT9J3C1_9BACL|nr:hypothetical protein [Chengkuizengella sp. 2205SS18-9]MDP5275927.1 hypothetical protein [Chengkuizengella sp. 2205SS18-9]